VVKLQLGAMVVELPDPSLPYADFKVPKQNVYEAQDGTRYVYTLAPPRRRWELKWNLLGPHQLDALRSFIEDVVNFSETPFYFTDSAGRIYKVRCIVFRHERVTPTTFSAALTLEEEL